MNRKLSRILLSGVASCLVCGVASQPAFAQVTAPAPADLQSEEIIVTAQRERSTVQRTSASIAVVGGEELSRQGAVQMDDVLDSVVGVTVQGQAKGFTPAIRGLGSDLPPGSAEGSVAVNFDGAYNIRAESGVAGYFDVGRVEVLRGPQGTLYGRNATAGVVNVISNDPVLGETSADLTFELGNYDLVRGEGALNLAAGDKVALRIAGQGVRRNGFLSNGADDNVSQGVRVKALIEPSAAFSLLVAGEYLHLGGKGAGGVPSYPDDNAPADPWATPAIVPGFFGPVDTRNTWRNYRQYKVWARFNLDLGFGNLSVSPTYTRADESEAGCFLLSCTIAAGDPRALDQYEGEVRLSSHAGAPIGWSFGAYHYDYAQTTYLSSVSPAPEINTTSLDVSTDAVFGQVTVPVGTGLRLIGGARYTWDHKQKTVATNFPGSGSGTRDWQHADWKAAVEFDVAPRSMLYASIATGYRPGGFNPSFSTFEPESLVSYEIGSKNIFLDGKLALNASAFYYDYTDYQAFDFVFVPAPQFVFYNTAVTNYGGELEARARPTANDTLGFAAAYVFTRFEDPLTLGPVNVQGEPIPHAPRWTLTGDYEHRFVFSESASLTLQGRARYTSSQYIGASLAPDSFQPAYFKADAFATLDVGLPFTLSAYVRNITHEPVKTNFVAGYNTLAEPRTYGLILKARFGN